MTASPARRLAAFAAFVLSGAAAQAGQLTVSSYDMINGDGEAHLGSYNYWDADYTGDGPTMVDGLSGSVLTGGLGKLTDGIIATQTWNAVSDYAGTGEYVGWRNPDVPTIAFHFAGIQHIDELKLYVDNSHIGGVTAPDTVVVDGRTFANPTWTTATGTEVIDLNGLGIVGDTVDVTLTDPTSWVFLSEAQFFGTVSNVPEPGNATLVLAGLALCGVMTHRRRRAA